LRDWERKRPVPDKEECERLLAWFHTPEAAVRHSRVVAELAVELADRVLKYRAERCVEMTYKSPPIDKYKIYAAALLHDIAKAYPEHPETGAGWLRLLGHTGIADIVADHMDLPEEKLGYLNESLIVYLADKQVQGERRVTIEERFAAKREKFKEALEGVERRYQLAKRAEALL
jgi:molybdenum cofactor cytidylyltransferase